MSNLERQMRALHAREIDFARYVRNTSRDYAALARHFLRRWPCPTWYGQGDVEQELYLGTWSRIWGYTKASGERVGWDPGRGVSLSRWVIFGVAASVKRSLHRARGACLHGSPDRAPSRYEFAFSSIDEDGGAKRLSGVVSSEPTPEELFMRAEDTRLATAAVLRECASAAERSVVLAIREAGSLDGAGLVLYGDLDSRVALRLGDEVAATRCVRRHARAVVRRVQQGFEC